MATTQNYTLGRGELHFAQFAAGTQAPKGERYFGNSPDLSFTASVQNLDHFSSDHGIREKDDSVPLQVDRTGSFTTDNVSPENLALFWFGSKSIVAVTAATAQSSTFNAVEPGLGYQLGTTDTSPAGARDVSNVVVTDDAGTPVTFDVGDDYVLDAELGRITIVEGGAITTGTNLVVTFDVAAHSEQRVVSGSTPIEGALRYIAVNPKGEQLDYFMPWVSITPNGDFAIKGDTWQTIPFNIEIKKKGSLEAVYVNGRPFTVAP